MNNFVGKLEEKITSLRVKQGVLLEKPTYASEDCAGGGFKCVGTLKNVSTKEEINVKSDSCNTKKEAKTCAAKLLFESEEFARFCTEKLPVVTPDPVPSPQASAPLSSPITTQAISNPKGYLNECVQKYASLRISYKPTHLSPFECEVQAEVLLSGLAPVTARSTLPRTTKKKAEQEATENLLRDPLWTALLAAAGGCPAAPSPQHHQALATAASSPGVSTSVSASVSASASAAGPSENPKAMELDLTLLQKRPLDEVISPPVLVEDPPELQAEPAGDGNNVGGGPRAGPAPPVLQTESMEPMLLSSPAPSEADASPMLLSVDGLSLAAPSSAEVSTSPSSAGMSMSAASESSGGNSGSSPASAGSTTSEAPNTPHVAAMSAEEADGDDEAKGDVQCASCAAVLGSVALFCLYKKSETDMEFIVKPEVALHLDMHPSAECETHPDLPGLRFEDRAAEKSGKIECRVVCSACDAALGHKLSTGPDGAQQCTIGGSKVKVLGWPVKSWRAAGTDPHFAGIERRTPSTFWGSTGYDRLLARPHNKLLVKFPVVDGDSIADSADYQYSDLLDPACTKIPHPEQVEAFHLALEHHTIVVFPTGFGKTLVASLVMHRFHLLNLRKLVVMVEERVTLVDQQSAAIQRDTGMSVHAMSGNNSTKYVLGELLSGKYDALVITAGVLHNYLNSRHLRVSDFSAIVFDECHHTNKDHLYKKIIDKVAQCPLELRPRVVGLTASPLKSDTVDAAYKELGELRASFLDAQVYRPVVVGAKLQGIHKHPVALSGNQQIQQATLLDQLRPILNELLMYLRTHKHEKYGELVGKKHFVLKPDGSPAEWQRVTNCAAKSHYDDTEVEALRLAKRCRELVHALHDNYLLGPAFVSHGAVDQSVDVDKALISPQLRTLCNILEERGETSCTLVFVSTRYLSSKVQRYLDARFPALRCEQVIGQGGDDGMVCAQQRRVLFDFHGKACKLIVCTSVLEEGLDVQGCDLVIRLGGSPSLIQLVQSKGRARHEMGQLHLIFTEEEQVHFDKLTKQEAMLDQVLTGAAARSASGPDRSYLKEFMRKSEAVLQLADYDSDVDSVMSSDSTNEKGVVASPGGDGVSEDEEEIHERREKNHSLTLLVCCKHPRAEDQLKLKLRSQAEIRELNKAQFVPRGARSAISDPRMFSSSDALALLSVKSPCARFLRYFSSMFDFKVEAEGCSYPLYVLVPPSVKITVKDVAPGDVSSTPTTPSSPVSGEKAVGDEQDESALAARLVEPLPVHSPEHTRISKVSDLRTVTTGWFVDRQSFLSEGTLGSSSVKYSRVRVEHGRTLLLEAVGGVERTSVLIPASILCKHAVVCASHASKTVVLFLTLTSTPSVFYEPNYKKERCDDDPLRIDKEFRVFSPNQDQEAGGTVLSGGQVDAQKDLQLLSRCPIIALTFPLAKWKRLMHVFTDPAALGLNVLVTRVENHDSVLSDCRQLVLASQVSAESLVHKLCQYTYATLVSDVYCAALNPAVLSLIKEHIEEAGGDERLLQIATTAMLRLHQHLQLRDLWQDAWEYFQVACAALEAGNVDSSLTCPAPSESLHEGYVMMKRIVATPSRLLLMPPVPTMTNRLIRMLGDKHQLVYVKFRDEQGQGIYDQAIFFGRFQSMLAHGLDVCGKPFRFLQCSNSQQREATAVFFDGTDDDVTDIRKLIIPDPESRFSRDIPKYISRLGLFCTADADTGVELTGHEEGKGVQNMSVSEDIFTSKGDEGVDGKILTDGSGLCGMEIMKRFQKEFFEKNGYYSCEIQIRARGYKGTLLCDPRPEPGRVCSENDVLFRNSMEKFVTESSRNMCVVKVAEFNPLTLNREVINLLCAIRDSVPSGAQSWNPHSTFVELQDTVLDGLGQMLVDPQRAIEKLSEHIPAATLQAMAASGVNILSEPLLMSMLHLRYFNDTKALRCKTHIPVPHGALLMGAPDPTGLLRDGEVFICVHRPAHGYTGCFEAQNEFNLGGNMKLIRVPETEEEVEAGTIGAGFETFVVTGPVLLYRNPCLDPGDHRVVTAVYKPELLFWKNVALLPADSLCRRSLSAECSGGDLDGDMFGVIWDHRLVPPQELTFEAVDYDGVMKEAKGKQAKPELIDWAEAARLRERIAEFIARAMCNSCLGKIAVLHLAVCDQLSNRAGRRGRGAGDPLARELAKAQSLAVDFPKTGVPPEVSKDAKALVRRYGRPHFMEKVEMLSYLSEQSLGLLYDVVSTVACTVELALSVKSRGPSSSADFIVPGCQQLDVEAASLYEQYKREVQSLMLRFKLQSEAEMVMGAPRAWSDEFALDQEAAALSLAACWSTLKKTYRRLFYDNLTDEMQATKQQKASAWHRVAYGAEHNQDGEKMHSFAWIVSEELASIRTSAPLSISAAPLLHLNGELSAHRAVAGAIGRTAAVFWQRRRSLLNNAIQMKTNVFRKVRDAILSSDVVTKGMGADKVEVHSYGSTVLLLCDPQSDLDITVHVPSHAKNDAQSILEKIVVPSVSSIADKRELVKGARIPLLKAVVQDGCNGTAVDISAQNMDGVHKSGLIRLLYLECPENLLVLSSIVQWARSSGLLRGFVLEERKAVLNSGQLQALFMSFMMHRSGNTTEYSADQLSNGTTSAQSILTRADELIKAGEHHNLGETMLSFFAFYSQLEPAEFQYRWPIPDAPAHTIGADEMREVVACCRRALHCLYLSWDWAYLLEHSAAFEKARTTLQMELSPALSKGIAANINFYATVLNWKSKAQVRITRAARDPAVLVVQGTGRYQQIQVLRHELLQMIYSGRMISYGAVRTMSNAYFMENSSFLYTRGAETKETMLEITPIGVEDYLMREMHAKTEQSTVAVCSVNQAAEDVWREEFKRVFCAKMLEQMAQLGKVADGGQVIFSVHVGKMLLLNASQSFEKARGARSCADIELAMNNARGNMKMENYRTGGEEDKKQPSPAQPKQPPSASSAQKAPSTAPGSGVNGKAGKLKSHLTTAFVSGVPILPARQTVSEIADSSPPLSVYEEKISEAVEKFAGICDALGYSKFNFDSLRPTFREESVEGAAGTGHAWRIPGTTLTVPTGEWRTAVDLNEKQQINFDLGPNGEVSDVVERFVSFVNGTLVDSASRCVTGGANGEAVLYEYVFREHDLRFKFGIMNPVNAERQKALLAQVCPDAKCPIEYFKSQELVAEMKDSSIRGGVTSRILTEYTQALLQAEKDFTCVRPAPSLSRPDMVSFARHVTRRFAYLSPGIVRDGGLDQHVHPAPAATATDNAPATNSNTITTAKVMAIMAVGEHFEGSRLGRVNPFVDISLEVDATQLLAAMSHTARRGASSADTLEAKNGADEGETSEEERGSDDGAEEGDLLGVEEVNAHIRDICDELLRVSATLKKMW